MKEAVGGELTDYPNDKYRLFFEKFKEIETIAINEWKPLHVLAYFCKKYEQHYEAKYLFKFNSPSPSKCFEIFQIKKLSMILSSQPDVLKEYIDWVYENFVPKAKRKLTSISFMTKDEIVNPYKMNLLTSTNINRSTNLPDRYKALFHDMTNINNYGDLAFLSQMDQTANIKLIFDKLNELGFDKNILDKIV